ncbi:YncE family protein [Streptomyces sp. NPDC001275]
MTTDHDGRVLKTIEGLDGARGMTLSRDESTLYVALSEADAIAAVDTTTLTETRRFATGAGTEPENLAVAGGKLWFSYQANLFDASIGSISVADADPVVDLGDDAVWYGKPQLAVSPGLGSHCVYSAAVTATVGRGPWTLRLHQEVRMEMLSPSSFSPRTKNRTAITAALC